jgi:predicted alpha/beta-hydrolase family hydrolase
MDHRLGTRCWRAMESSFMNFFAEKLAERRIRVVRFEFLA